MRKVYLALAALAIGLLAGVLSPRRPSEGAAAYHVVSWNNLGMHCLDSDFSVFSILPPYNTVYAQLVDQAGHLVASPGAVTLTYEGVADPAGSINTTSIGKTNFWANAKALFGATLAPDVGLTGLAMPGAGNVPQAMKYDAATKAWIAEGIPITPYDDAGHKNPYPMMRITAKGTGGTVLATAAVVLPVSDEMDCRACHGSNTSAAARPEAGWVNDPNPDRDYRLNVIKLHDDRQNGDPVFTAALAAAGYQPTGLYDTVTKANTPVLCAKCHASNALGTTGLAGTAPLTKVVHERHASVTDPTNGQSLNASTNRSACYRCHPGSTTRCLRGAMGSAVAADGSMAIQCQSCHGRMRDVGDATRQGWLQEPTCQSCHTGDAVRNAGQLRYTTAFDAAGRPRQAVTDLFATNPNTPAAGLNLYRFSTSHGGLYCEACHGSTHAEYPALHGNDNVQPSQLQGHIGVIAECDTCHGTQPNTVSGGPHGLHPVGQPWIQRHSDAAEGGSDACKACHGADLRGTVLSRALGPRTVQAFGQKTLWQGFQLGCYSCHNGPGSEERNPNQPAVVSDATTSTPLDTPVAIDLRATDPNGDPLTLRIVRQPDNGTVALANRTATYRPFPGFVGRDPFTFAAWDGSTDSNLGTVTVNVIGPDTPTPGPSPATPTVTTTAPASPTAPTATTVVPTQPSATATTVVTPGPERVRVWLPIARKLH
jgi:hypothetical protein